MFTVTMLTDLVFIFIGMLIMALPKIVVFIFKYIRNGIRLRKLEKAQRKSL